MNPELTIQGSTDPVSLSEAKSSQRITGTGEDTFLQSVLNSTIELAESSTGLALRENTYTLRLKSFSDAEFVDSGVIRIPVFPLKSVTSIKYYDSDNVQQTLVGGTDYEVNIYSEPGVIQLATGKSWPTVYSKVNPVEIVFVAGYDNTGLDMTPEKLKQAIKMAFGELNNNREDMNGKRLPTSVEKLFIREKRIY